MSSAISCRPADSALASLDSSSSSGTIANRSSVTGLCSLSSAESVEEVGDQPLHVLRLVLHQLQDSACVWLLVQSDVRERLDEAG